MAVTMLTGTSVGTTGNITGIAPILANRKVIDMRDKLYLLQPEAAQRGLPR